MECNLSHDPLDYLRLTINITLDYGISASGEVGTLCGMLQSVPKATADMAKDRTRQTYNREGNTTPFILQ